MDTRRKILTPEQAIECARWIKANVIVGHFDVLRAALIKQISEAARPLFAIVLDAPDSLLPLRARAELAAAVRVIDYVIPIASEPAELIAAIAPRDVTYEVPHNLIEHVRDRHKEPKN